MNPADFEQVASTFDRLHIGVVGDFCLDRYLEIDPTLTETSIETGLPVHNVVRVRAQPGAAGTVLNNLVALGVGKLDAIGFCGEDGEGFELQRSLAALPGVSLTHFSVAPNRRTFTYCKPLVLEPDAPPRELNRLDSRNWTPTPRDLEERLVESLRTVAHAADAIIVLDQVDQPETGVVTSAMRRALGELPPTLPVIADSRQGLAEYPALIFKMNDAELRVLCEVAGQPVPSSDDALRAAVVALAARNRRDVIVTQAERGLIGATSEGQVCRVPAHPVPDPIDIVGAGDSVTANVAAALAAHRSLRDALEIAAAAASVVVRQLGTTGVARPAEIAAALENAPPPLETPEAADL